MFFKFLHKKKTPHIQPQTEYVELLIKIMQSPFWDGSDEQLRQALPRDLTDTTIEYARHKLDTL